MTALRQQMSDAIRQRGFAARTHQDGSNPCLHVKKYVEQKRAQFLSAEEFAALGKALREVEQDGSESQSAVHAVRLLILTGCRLGEIMTTSGTPMPAPHLLSAKGFR